MPKFKMIALSNAVKGSEPEFNKWYDEEHLKDVSALPGVYSAQRLKLTTGDSRWSNLAIYEVETDDPKAVIAEMMQRITAGKMRTSDALDRENVYFGVFGETT